MEEKKSNLGLWVVIGVLFVAIVGLSFFLGTKLANKDDKKGNDTKEEVKDELKDISLSDSLVKEASMFNATGLCGGPIIEFNKKDIAFSEFDENIKFNMVVYRYLMDIVKTVDSDEKFELPVSKLNRYFEDLSFVNKYVSNNDRTVLYPASVKLKDNVLIFGGYATGCEGAYEGINTKLVGAKKSEKQLVLDYAYFYQTYDYDEERTDVYFGKDDKKPVETDVKVDEETFELLINPKLYDHYEFVFDLSGGNLRLEKIVYVAKK